MRSNSVNIETFKDMLKRYEDFKMKNKREPRVIFIRSGGGESVPLETFKDMLKRYEAFKKKNGREPALIYLDPLGRSGDYVNLATFKDMLKRYTEFKKKEGREPNYVSIRSPFLGGAWTTKVIEKIGTFHDATSLYERVKKTCKYKYYYNDQVPNHVAVMRMTTSGINCTDACQLFEKVFLEMGYEARIEHCKVKCRDGEWYGHYLLRVGGFELKDGTIWDYVSATKTGRPLGKPCCVNGFKHLGWGIVSPRYD